MSDQYTISTFERLLMRLTHAVNTGQRVTFLIGSGVTCPSADGKERGIPGPLAMVTRARHLFPNFEEVTLFDAAVNGATDGQKYQAAMQFVIECRGQPAVDGLIREVVLEARLNPSFGVKPEVIERDVSGWSLRPGIEALGLLIKNYPAVFQRPILTSNFDPLLEIAIRRAGGNAISINLPADGNFNSLVVNENIAQVVHFHGFWSEENTLHTPETLTRDRPLLAGNLQKLLQETVLVVIGYGGWNDVFTKTLLKVVSEQAQGINVLWTFYTNDIAQICERNGELLSSFSRLPGQRIVPYAGVDCNHLFPKLLKSLNGPEKPVAYPVAAPVIRKATSYAMRGTANLPATDAWVGRQKELTKLLETDCSVLALNGWGGFGKSSLAAHYITEREKVGNIEGWYWSDCREQGNSIQTHLINVLDDLTQGQVNAISLQKAQDEDILELFIQHLSKHRILLVFDNIDHYVDLENQKAIGMMNQLIERATTMPNPAQIILTSRPTLHYESNRFFSMEVSGLGAQETEELFDLRGAPWDGSNKSEQVQLVLKITEGSALQLNLIATQVVNRRLSLSILLQRIQEGTAPEAEDRVLEEVWTTLKPQHQEVLRVLAELPHPEPEQRVGDCLIGSMNYNRFAKAVLALKSLNLIVKKPAATSGEVIELHPLVRTFIRKRYPKEDQVPIVEQIIKFFERMIVRHKGRPEMGSIAVLADWIAKIEVCLDNDRPAEALSSLKDISVILLSRGYVEEFVRLGSLVLSRYKVQDNPAELKKFDSVSEKLVDVLGDLGRYDEADKWIGILAATVVGKSARYIWLCKLRAYAYWIRGKFDEAKMSASEGYQLKVASNIDTDYDCAHTLALARRDSGEVAEALASFLDGTKIEDVLKPAYLDDKRGGPFYGNIGRCLQLQNKNEEALVCLKKSAYLLEKDRDESNILLNRGYAAMWLGEVHSKMNEADLAYIAFRSASGKWKVVSPARSKAALQRADMAVENLKDAALAGRGDWECDEMYKNWLKA